MLAFVDDAAMFRVLLGATAVPRSERHQWLKRVAAMVDSPPARTAQALRSARARRRRANGKIVIPVEIDAAFVSAALSCGAVSEAEALDPHKLASAAAVVLQKWAAHWKNKRHA
jgi:hypothetical protein